MAEIGIYMTRILGDSAHKGRSISLRFQDILHHCLSTSVLFQIVVEIFIGIVFRGIRRQIEKHNFILVSITPLRNLSAVMDAQIVKDKISFSPLIVSQAACPTCRPLLFVI